jgi:hypothetical protein
MTEDEGPAPVFPVRPGDFARVLLAAGGEPPRARARDQQADILGETIKRQILNRLVALDPEPFAFESALATIISEMGEPSGANRAVSSAILEEWQMVMLSPGFWPFLLGQAMEADERATHSRKRRGPLGK